MNNDFYQNLLSSIEEGIYFVDNERKITFWNKGAELITGFKSEEVVGRHCYDNILNHVDDAGNQLCFGGCPLHKTIADGEPRHVKVFLHHKDGHRVPVNVRSAQIVQNDEVIGAVELFNDDSQYREIAHNLEELTSIALHDQLTELPNRRYLETFLTSKLQEYTSLGIHFGVIFIDIDHFKNVNDTYGHAVGDDVLRMVAKSMQSCLRSSDLLARNGGEEFVAVLPIDAVNKLTMVAEKLRILVQSSALRIEDKTVKVTISLGTTLVNDEDTIESVLDRADRMMYHSKTNGRNQVTHG